MKHTWVFLIGLLSVATSPGHSQESTPATPIQPTVEPAIIQLIEDKYSTEVSKAEGELAKVKHAASTIRLKAYKDRLVELTKSGDFDKAIAIKARIEQLEKESILEPSKPSKRSRPKDTVKFGGHTYALIKEPVTWHVAKRKCEEIGGHLVILDNASELKFVSDLCKKAEASAWMGASDEESEGDWRWIDGSDALKLVAPFVSPNKHNIENFLCFSSSLNMLNDCGTDRLFYVCEWVR